MRILFARLLPSAVSPATATAALHSSSMTHGDILGAFIAFIGITEVTHSQPLQPGVF